MLSTKLLFRQITKGELRMAKHPTQPWIPLYTNKWLNGSTRDELRHDERAIFADLLCLASQNGGYIGANVEDGFPYSNKRLSDILAAPLKLIERTLQRCLDTNKIERLENGILKIIKWEEYQLSDRWIRKLNSAKTEYTSENQEDYSEKADSIGEERREEKNRKENTKDAKASRKHNWEYSWEEIEASKSEAWKCLATFEKLWFERDGQGQFGADFDRKEAIGRINNWLGLGWKVRDWLQVFFDTKDEFIVKHSFEQFRKFVEREAKKGVK